MAGKKKKGGNPQEIRNAKVHRDYIVEDTFEAGIVLTGTEVKSIRAGKAQISDGFCRFNRGEFFINGLHIDEYAFGNINNHIPRRERKLLLKKSELRKIERALEAGGKSAIPTRIYFKEALIKIEIGICTGKKLFDKREDLKKKAQMRDADRDLKSYRVR
ncbi:SsrA-binding protein SmpB [Pelagicoccus mobilis]|uniref:SsrA-binding protein n=1 Tax=Pelagicoccus mobilis TaxID=415221 RepID=A0A934RXR2_9BACT|nr:SsrA-binding protein SmpB [Pelagicoccus mobilis]MBK1877169.1 SsrA-binding protein SmpB [Pelagicoccus mobilis]